MTAFGDLLHEQHRIAGLLIDAATLAGQDPTFHKFLPLAKVADKLLDCAKTPYLTFDPNAVEFHLHEYRCRSRLCARCTIQRSEILRANLAPLAKELNSPRFITLTLKASDDSLSDQLKKLTRSFAKLRAQKLWKKTTAGGFYTIEVTFNEKSQRWNPHLHAIIDGRFIPQKELSSCWFQATGDSAIVDIRACRDRQQALHYITKYVSKTNDAKRYPDHKIAEWAASIKGLRFVSTFGHLRGRKIIDEETKTDREFAHVGYLAPLAHAARHGNDRADSLWESAIKEAQTGALPEDPGRKEIAIERRLNLYRQLTLWIGHYEETGGFLQEDEEEPPPLPDPALSKTGFLFSTAPPVGNQ